MNKQQTNLDISGHANVSAANVAALQAAVAAFLAACATAGITVRTGITYGDVMDV